MSKEFCRKCKTEIVPTQYDSGLAWPTTCSACGRATFAMPWEYRHGFRYHILIIGGPTAVLSFLAWWLI